MRGYRGFDEFISARGGIVTRRELLQAGWTPDEIYFGREYGNLRRIRHGWYTSSDLPPLVRLGWAAGEPLACVSALVHHGVLHPDDPRNARGSIHVALPRHGNRLRTISRTAEGLRVVTHWGDEGRREPLPPVDRRRESDPRLTTRRRHAVSVDLALRQFTLCRAPGSARATSGRA